MHILMPLPRADYDPSEAGVSHAVLTAAGHRISFATPDARPAQADPLMLDGCGFDAWGRVPGLRRLPLIGLFLRANRRARAAHAAMTADPAYARPLHYAAVNPQAYDGLLLPGGHAQGMREYLESAVLQQVVAGFFAAGKPVGAICHGVVLAARSRRADGRSVLHGRRSTALTRAMELSAWALTALWLGDYYRTYPQTVQAEVSAALARPEDFETGPLPLRRDSPDDLAAGFVLRDGHYLSARWPGDAHRFASTFEAMLREASTLTSGLPRDPVAAASSRSRC